MILSLAEAREHVTTTLGDAALQRLLDRAEEDIIDVLGPPDSVQEYLHASGDIIMLSRRASAITTILENDVELEDDDYELRANGQTIRRLRTGTTPSTCWRHRVDVTYVPDDEGKRQGAQVALVKLDVDFAPGINRERIGEWEQEQASGGSQGVSYDDQRRAILASLTDSLVLL